MLRPSFFILVSGLIAINTTRAAADDPAIALHKLFGEYDEWLLSEFPERAMSRGDYRFSDRITDSSLAAIERRHVDRSAFAQRLQSISRDLLSDEDRLNYDLFDWMLRQAIDGHAFQAYLMPIGSRDGPHQSIPQMHERVRFASITDYENYLARLDLVPKWIDDTIGVLRAGIANGRTPPKIALAGVSDQLQKLIEPGGLDPLSEPFAKVNRVTASEEQAGALHDRFRNDVLAKVRAALARLADYFDHEYYPACRENIAATDLPNGEAYYAHQLRYMTTTTLNAREIHEIGLHEVARIRAEMLQVIRRSDFLQLHPDAAGLSDAELLKAFIRYLRTDPRFYCRSEEELLAGYRDVCKQIDAWMPKLFHVLPRLPYGVRKIPDFMAPTQTTAYYQQGDIRNAEPGYFYANTFALDQRPKYEMRALAIHEAVPGHHHQVAIAQELRDVPEFRRNLWITAFGEGWALYSERLGIEMGMYADPYDDFGRLIYEMWRACRLVVDPGMHALRWTREQAVAFMLENTALSEININAEIDRYISWPGQATAYKIGELKIRELRALAEQALGASFDLRAFHDVLLSAGSLPLDVLEARVKAWITRCEQSRKAGEAP